MLDLLGEIPRDGEVRAMERFLEHRLQGADDGQVAGVVQCR